MLFSRKPIVILRACLIGLLLTSCNPGVSTEPILVDDRLGVAFLAEPLSESRLIPSGNPFQIATNNCGSSVISKETFSRERDFTVKLNADLAQELRGKIGGSLAVAKAEAEAAIELRFGVEIGAKETIGVEKEIITPPNTISIITLQWEELWDSGEVSAKQNDLVLAQIPFGVLTTIRLSQLSIEELPCPEKVASSSESLMSTVTATGVGSDTPTLAPPATPTNPPITDPIATLSAVSTSTSTHTPVILATPINPSIPNPTATFPAVSTPTPTYTRVVLVTPTATATATSVPTATARPTSLAYVMYSLEQKSELTAPETNLGLGPGRVTLLDIPFETGWKATTQCSYLPDRPTTLTFVTNLANPYRVHLLLQAGWGIRRYAGSSLGRVSLAFAGGNVLNTNLVLGNNIRDWAVQHPDAVSTVTSPAVQEAWRGLSPTGELGRMDVLTLEIPEPYRQQPLESIVIEDTSILTTGEMNPCIHLLAVTVLYNQ